MLEKELDDIIYIIKDTFVNHYKKYYNITMYPYQTNFPSDYDISPDNCVNFCIVGNSYNKNYSVNINYDHIVEKCYKNEKKYYMLLNSFGATWMYEYVPSNKTLYLNWCKNNTFKDNIQKLLDLTLEYSHKKYIKNNSNLDLGDFIWFNNLMVNCDLFKLFEDSPIKNLIKIRNDREMDTALIFELFISDDFYYFIKINEIKNV